MVKSEMNQGVGKNRVMSFDDSRVSTIAKRTSVVGSEDQGHVASWSCVFQRLEFLVIQRSKTTMVTVLYG